WFDLGYNFLVDRFGRAWVGRSGGADRLVQGAHTLGFNHASVGIAVIGNLDRSQSSPEAVTALVKLASWKLDRHGRYADGKVTVTSSGSDKYPEGTRVRLPAIDGHRDTNDTACPGLIYDKLPGIRQRAQRRIDRW
ncbi:MAG TPA: N-acetylmuramoyl-L-alanine amidase, partial [Nocardioides sp.]|nr:N-acetylmuramoyl-L-alanine amidase [Nocardioides sp.]